MYITRDYTSAKTLLLLKYLTIALMFPLDCSTCDVKARSGFKAKTSGEKVSWFMSAIRIVVIIVQEVDTLGATKKCLKQGGDIVKRSFNIILIAVHLPSDFRASQMEMKMMTQSLLDSLEVPLVVQYISDSIDLI